MRESFASAAWQHALNISLPPQERLSQTGLTLDTLPATPIATLDETVRRWDFDKALAGTLDWNREQLAWVARWRLLHDGAEKQWASRA